MILAGILAKGHGATTQAIAPQTNSAADECSPTTAIRPITASTAAPDIVVKIAQLATTPRKRKRHGADCAVAHCPHFFARPGSEYIHFHKFPVSETTRALWVKLCQRKDMPNPNNARLCSEHFKPEDYLELTKAGKSRERAHLKAESLPSQFACLYKTVKANIPAEQLNMRTPETSPDMEGSFENASCWISDCGYGISSNVANVRRFVFFRSKGTPDYFAWLRALPKEARSGASPETLQICEAHFADKDITRNLECRLDDQGKVIHTILPPTLSNGALPINTPVSVAALSKTTAELAVDLETKSADSTYFFTSFQQFHTKVMIQFLKWKQPRVIDATTAAMQRWKLEVADNSHVVVFYQTELVPRFRVTCTIEFHGSFQPRLTNGEKDLPKVKKICSWSDLIKLLLSPNINQSKFHL